RRFRNLAPFPARRCRAGGPRDALAYRRIPVFGLDSGSPGAESASALAQPHPSLLTSPSVWADLTALSRVASVPLLPLCLPAEIDYSGWQLQTEGDGRGACRSNHVVSASNSGKRLLPHQTWCVHQPV